MLVTGQRYDWLPVLITLTRNPELGHDMQQAWKNYLRDLKRAINRPIWEREHHLTGHSWKSYRDTIENLQLIAIYETGRSGEHYHIHAAAIFRDLPDHAKIDPMRHAEDARWQISKPPAKWPLSHFRDHWEPIRTDYNDTWGRLGHHWSFLRLCCRSVIPALLTVFSRHWCSFPSWVCFVTYLPM